MNTRANKATASTTCAGTKALQAPTSQKQEKQHALVKPSSTTLSASGEIADVDMIRWKILQHSPANWALHKSTLLIHSGDILRVKCILQIIKITSFTRIAWAQDITRYQSVIVRPELQGHCPGTHPRPWYHCYPHANQKHKRLTAGCAAAGSITQKPQALLKLKRTLLAKCL